VAEAGVALQLADDSQVNRVQPIIFFHSEHRMRENVSNRASGSRS
jgi:hypothetical protein